MIRKLCPIFAISILLYTNSVLAFTYEINGSPHLIRKDILHDPDEGGEEVWFSDEVTANIRIVSEHGHSNAVSVTFRVYVDLYAGVDSDGYADGMIRWVLEGDGPSKEILRWDVHVDVQGECEGGEQEVKGYFTASADMQIGTWYLLKGKRSLSAMGVSGCMIGLCEAAAGGESFVDDILLPKEPTNYKGLPWLIPLLFDD
jgi:hypothetical protein